MHMNGETVKMSFKGKSCMKWAVGLKINESVNNSNPGVHLPPTPGQYTCVLLS